MQISVQHDLHKLTRHLNDLQKKQVPYATKIALNNTAVLAKEAEQREINQLFDRPTPFTRNALWVKWARPNKLEAIVKLKDEATKGTPAAKYLAAQITGGQRKHKGFEKLLIGKGLMPTNMFAVPSRTLPLDAYGNASRGLIQRILSGLGAQRDIYQNAKGGKRSRTAGRYFAGIIRGVHGIWDVKALHNGGPALLFIYVRAPHYQKRYDFQAVANRIVRTRFGAEFSTALRHALATAR